eukprot:TRINITY_DN37739_c0_g2_i1.p1 TRINITY_DN37739_c0_g2~~TRINITY_DN37739_c0_g2_i1.p1  ORF type:complete len:511 (-),score=78.43 TRINITY_DN37739_c0_g2_i1:8-1540(-)
MVYGVATTVSVAVIGYGSLLNSWSLHDKLDAIENRLAQQLVAPSLPVDQALQFQCLELAVGGLAVCIVSLCAGFACARFTFSDRRGQHARLGLALETKMESKMDGIVTPSLPSTNTKKNTPVEIIAQRLDTDGMSEDDVEEGDNVLSTSSAPSASTLCMLACVFFLGFWFLSDLRNIEPDCEGIHKLSQDISIVAVGKTGVGKSTSLSTLTGVDQAFRHPEEADIASTTSRIKCLRISARDDATHVTKSLFIVDTPGFRDSREEDEVFRHEAFSKFAGVVADGVDVFIFIVKWGVWTTDETQLHQEFLNWAGEKAKDHSIYVFTHAGKKKSQELRRSIEKSGHKDLKSVVRGAPIVALGDPKEFDRRRSDKIELIETIFEFSRQRTRYDISNVRDALAWFEMMRARIWKITYPQKQHLKMLLDQVATAQLGASKESFEVQLWKVEEDQMRCWFCVVAVIAIVCVGYRLRSLSFTVVSLVILCVIAYVCQALQHFALLGRPFLPASQFTSA